MDKIKCVVIDDEPLALELMSQYIAKFPALQLVQTFEDAISGIEYLNKYPVDLLFLDINMPDITGIDLAKSLEIKPMLVFTTAYKKFAFEGFELEALDYLLKPIDLRRFSKSVEKIIDYHQYRQNPKSSSSESIYVHSEYKLIGIELNQITYIESFEDYITIHQTIEKSVSTLMSLKKILEKLPEKDFKRVHRSYIVALKHVKSVSAKSITLRSNSIIPIGDSYSKIIKDWLQTNLNR